MNIINESELAGSIYGMAAIEPNGQFWLFFRYHNPTNCIGLYQDMRKSYHYSCNRNNPQ